MSICSLPLTNLPGSKESGSPVSPQVMLREASCPHIGQSPANPTAGRASRASTTTNRRCVSEFTLTYLRIRAGALLLHPFEFHLVPLRADAQAELVEHVPSHDGFVDVVP